MKSIRLLGAAIIAVLAFGVVGVATAAADAELGAASLPAKVTTEGVGASKLTSSVGVVTCTSHSSTGEFTTEHHGTLTIKFKGCTTEGEAVSCKSTGAAAGEIVVPVLVLLVSLKHETNLLLGILIEPEPTLDFKCGVLAVEVDGSVLGAFPGVVSGTTIPTTESKELQLKVSSGKQEYTTCEDGLTCTSEQTLLANFGTGFKAATQESTDKVKFSVAVKPTF